jgi:Putative lumazine-binding
MGATVEQAVEDYLDGMVLAQADATRRAFHPDAAIVGHDAHGLEWLSVEAFASLCAEAGAQPGGRDAYARITAIETVGDIARVTLEDDYAGCRYTDYLTLLRVGGAWRIVNKAFFNHGPAAPP